MPELSVIIPARNEEWLARTIDDVLEHSTADTEIIAVLDGYWPDPGLTQHERVTLVHRPEPIGQRAATNEAARISRAPYLMKLDAHCSVSKGFDTALLQASSELQNGELQVPRQYNLHVFDWVCECGHRRDQGPTKPCEKCGRAMRREVLWQRRRETTAWRFDRNLKFQYWGKWKHTEEGKKPLAETMSLLGACWFVGREKYWELGGLDEEHGSWGQMGTELACKWWLSGSRVVCNKNAWFAHLFRTQGGDFSFPYPIHHHQTEKARDHSKAVWRADDPSQLPRWPQAIRPLQWLIEHFAPVPDWHREGEGGGAHEMTALPTGGASGSQDMPPVVTSTARGGGGLSKGIVFYTDGLLDPKISEFVRKQLRASTNGHRIVGVELGPVTGFGDISIHFADRERGYLTMFEQILAGLRVLDTDVAFLCEHDVAYPPDHFAFCPPEESVIYYNEHVWKVNAKTGHAVHYRVKQTSGLCAYRKTLLEHYERRVELVRAHGFSRRMGFEPGTHGRKERVDDLTSDSWWTRKPLVDIRHDGNLTPSRWSPEEFRNKRFCQGWTEADEIPGWGKVVF